MGVSVYYRGRIAEPDRVLALAGSFAKVRAAIRGLAEGLRRHGLSADAAEDEEMLAVRIEWIARQVQQTMSRPAEHPPF